MSMNLWRLFKNMREIVQSSVLKAITNNARMCCEREKFLRIFSHFCNDLQKVSHKMNFRHENSEK